MRVALMGYGRFGRAFASLFKDTDIELRAFDPHIQIPENLRMPTISALVEGADIVVVAVPVVEMKNAFLSLKPHLNSKQLVMDVGSVKVHPIEMLESVFGDDIPWVGSHPLFGPTSLALAERPIRVIVCPNPKHDEAAARARLLYEDLGCVVIEQDAHAHDRTMAMTHALAFFVAKGMLDVGAGEKMAFSPPSFQAIARTVETVRSDAGHLFLAIQKENPYSADARKHLLEALTVVDNALTSLEPTNYENLTSRHPLAIPDLGARSPELREAREHIDVLDREIIGLLARRAQLAHRAIEAKESLGHGVLDPNREAALLRERKSWAEEQDLEPESVDDVFQAILRFSRRVQRKRRK